MSAAQLTTADARGMCWWNNLAPAQRAHWLATSGSAVPALAWECFKRSSARPAVTSADNNTVNLKTRPISTDPAALRAA